MSASNDIEFPAFLDRRAALACLRCRAELAPCSFAVARACAEPGCPIVTLAAAADTCSPRASGLAGGASARWEEGPIDLPQFLGGGQ